MKSSKILFACCRAARGLSRAGARRPTPAPCNCCPTSKWTVPEFSSIRFATPIRTSTRPSHTSVWPGPQSGPDDLSFPRPDYRTGPDSLLGLDHDQLDRRPQVRISRRTRQLQRFRPVELLTAALQRDYVKDRGELELHLPPSGRPYPSPTKSSRQDDRLARGGREPQFCRDVRIVERPRARRALGSRPAGPIWREVPVARRRSPRGQVAEGRRHQPWNAATSCSCRDVI